MTKHVKAKTGKPILIRLTPDNRAKIEKLAAEAQLSLTDFCTLCCLHPPTFESKKVLK